MKIFFFVLIGLSLFHFIYNGIILPSIRLGLRYKLFSLRDQLRWLKMRNDKEISPEVFSYVEGSINITIRLLHSISLELFAKAEQEIKKDENFYNRIEKRSQIIQACSIREIEEIERKNTFIFAKALAANSDGLFIYLFPIALFFAFMSSLKKAIVEIISIPEWEVERIIPAGNSLALP